MDDDLNLRMPEKRATAPVVRRDESISGFLEMQKKDTFLKKKTRWFYKTGQKEMIPYLADPDLADQDQEVNFIVNYTDILDVQAWKEQTQFIVEIAGRAAQIFTAENRQQRDNWIRILKSKIS